MELLKASPPAFVLAYVIAYRARYSDGFNRHELGLGESFLGDFENYGMSEQQYRTAKSHLAKWGFATFRSTNKGTIGKLIDTRLFSTFRLKANGQNHTPATDKPRTANGQATTNKICSKNPKNVKEGGEDPAPGSGDVSGAQRISWEKERERIAERLKRIRAQASENAFGPMYDDQEKAELKKLRARDAELKEKLGCMI